MAKGKEVAAETALKYVRDGQVIGVGTGSTAMAFLTKLARLVKEGALRDVLLVPTSTEAELEIIRQGLGHLLRYPWQIDDIDIAIDGADEVDREKNLVKGGGGALTREKIIDYWAREFIVIVDESKFVDRIPARTPIPIEVLPYAWPIVKKRLESEYDGEANLRIAGSGKRGPVVTDNGNYIIDFKPRSPINPVKLEHELKVIPGVVEVGIFNGSKVKRVIIGYETGLVEILE